MPAAASTCAASVSQTQRRLWLGPRPGQRTARAGREPVLQHRVRHVAVVLLLRAQCQHLPGRFGLGLTDARGRCRATGAFTAREQEKLGWRRRRQRQQREQWWHRQRQRPSGALATRQSQECLRRTAGATAAAAGHAAQHAAGNAADYSASAATRRVAEWQQAAAEAARSTELSAGAGNRTKTLENVVSSSTRCAACAPRPSQSSNKYWVCSQQARAEKNMLERL